jgi:LAS superfamily LD-carboxypeptidase LdcB
MRVALLFFMVFHGCIAFTQSLSTDELLGKIDAAQHPDFVKIDQKYTAKSNIYMRNAAYVDFVRMAEAAANEGIKLQIISATRSFSYQKGIWERKWNQTKYMGWQDLDKAKDILKYSAMPGSSRHHWGTDIDLNALENNYFTSGEGKQVYDWLCANAPKFGFVQVYTAREPTNRQGYAEEKWHWSYLPLADEYLKQYNALISYTHITGFLGANLNPQLHIIENYVNGIAK